jgi:CRP-like cAMP-binding protein
MRYLDEALTKKTLKSSALETPEHLFKVAEYYVRQNMYNHAYFAYYQYLKYCPTSRDINIAKERIAKIKPYAKVVYLQEKADEITRIYPKDTMIFSESQPGNELYIIQKGSVKITKIVDNNEILIAILKAGDIFGEMSLLENKPRSASAIAYEDSILMAVNKVNFQRMVSQQPQMITRLTQLLADRIWLIYGQLKNTQLSNPIGRLYDALYLQLEKNRVPISPRTQHTFSMGSKELLDMVGIAKENGNTLITELFKNKKLKLVDNKIVTIDTEEISKQAVYFRKMEKIEKARQKNSILST